MAQEPSSSSSQTLDSSNEITNPSLTRNISLSRLNAKAPEFVPRTTTTPTAGDLSQPRLVVSPPPTSPGIIHVYPTSNSVFHAPIQPHVPVHHHHHAPLQYHHHPQNHHHSHHNQNYNQRPYHDQKGVVQAQKIVHGDPELKDGLTDEASQKIVNQVEYYFSDINLATTDHLMRFIHKDPEGYVPISVVISFNKIKALVSSNAQLASILRRSTKLVVSEDGKKVKRQHPLTESDMEELQSRIIVAENLPEDHCHQNLMKVFSAVGSVKTIRTCQPQTSNGGASSASRPAKADNMSFSNKLHAFVEYESIEFAEKAALELNKEASWRNGLKVRLMRRPPQAKPASQARGKKAEQENESVYKEEDTSTSEQHPLNEKHVNDSHQQSDVQSHEHVRQQAEDHSNEEGVGHNKKGRNRGRGKGRLRPQYNNRGTHVVTPPASNSVNNDHPIIGKQPPGPRMPDGTRGFAMGRGKPITLPIESSIS